MRLTGQPPPESGCRYRTHLLGTSGTGFDRSDTLPDRQPAYRPRQNQTCWL